MGCQKARSDGIVRRNGERISEIALAYAGETIQFAAKVPAKESGLYELIVYAGDPRNGNTGSIAPPSIVTGG